MKKAYIYIDGAARGNPGPAGAGVIIYLNDHEHRISKYLGVKTNNEAEYHALIMALEAVYEMGVRDVVVHSDSELLVKQMRGEYRVKNERIRELFEKASRMASEFDSFEIIHVGRENNRGADKLANDAIDSAPAP